MLSSEGDRAGGSAELIDVERERDGTLRLRGAPLREHPQTLVAILEDAARRAPERTFLMRRDARGTTHRMTFAQAAERSRRVATGLLALGASAQRPVVILSGNSIPHASIALGAHRAGIPVVPVQPRLTRSTEDGYQRLRTIAELVRPGIVFALDGAAYGDAAAAVFPEIPFVSVTEPVARPGRATRRNEDFAWLLRCEPLVEDRRVDAETIAKIMFVADAAGEPLGVPLTHGMLCAMLQGVAQAWPFLEDEPPVIVDALPWSRAFGGNTVFGIALRHAGTLVIDDPSTFIARGEVAPTIAFDVPRWWDAWVERLRADDALRRRWLSRLRMACWSGARLSPATHDALRAIGVPLVATWSVTEAAGTIAVSRYDDRRGDALGVPLAGVELKLVAHDDGYEARIRARQVMTGYFWRPDATAAAFDDEGFLRTGDVVHPVDPHEPARGVAYGGRVDDRFKLSTGTWVRAGDVRAAFLAQCPDVAECIVTGEGRQEVGLLVWPSADGMLLSRDALRAQIAAAMRRVATPRRALILDRHVTADDRARAIARLHASEPDADVIVA